MLLLITWSLCRGWTRQRDILRVSHGMRVSDQFLHHSRPLLPPPQWIVHCFCRTNWPLHCYQTLRSRNYACMHWSSITPDSEVVSYNCFDSPPLTDLSSPFNVSHAIGMTRMCAALSLGRRHDNSAAAVRSATRMLVHPHAHTNSKSIMTCSFRRPLPSSRK